MDLLIFNPPRYRSGHHHKFNNALLWLASYLHQRQVSVRVVPLNTEHFTDVLETELARYRPRYVAISCKWWDTLYSSTWLASRVKRFDPSIVTIAGGHTATFFAQELVDQTAFDVVVRGDGEEPLFRLVSGQMPLNCVFKGDRELVPVRKQYVQTQDTLKDICLVEDLEEILSDTSVLNSYIWTGKGCTETCAYCSANAWNNVQSFGRARFVYRPIDVVLREIELLSRYPGSGRVTFDFDPLRGQTQETYYHDVLAALPRQRHNCYFYSWSLPSKQLVDALVETFNFVELCIDVQTASERLRKLLGDRRFLKPYFSDEDLDDVLAHCARYDNLVVDLSTLMGLPLERDEDVARIRPFSDDVYDRYPDVRYPYVSPMNVEPGSLLLRSPERYEMVLFRKDFRDFMQYTHRSFEENINCYQPESYGEGVFHPLGVASKEHVEHGHVFRVYETWKTVQAHVDQRSRERSLARTRKYLRYGLLKPGIQGGIDRPNLVRAEVE
jgi:radical SAM superfamily enzyme YgiQ (UPF0313 family)